MPFPFRNQIAVVSDEDGALFNSCVWDVKTGSILAKYKLGHSHPRCLSLIGSDYLIGGLKNEKFINIWSLTKKGGIDTRIPCLGQVTALAVTPDGAYCVGAISSKIYLWEINTGDMVCSLSSHYQCVNCIKFTDNGQYFVSGGEDGLVIAWSLSDVMYSVTTKGDNSSVKPMHIWRDHSLGVTDIHIGFFGINARVLTVSKDRICKIYDLSSGKCMFTVFTMEELYSVTSDATENFLYLGTGSGTVIRIFCDTWHAEDSITIKNDYQAVFPGHSGAVTCLSISIDGSYLLSGANDGIALIRDVMSGQRLHTLEHSGPITNAFFSLCPDALLRMETKTQTPKITLKKFKFAAQTFNDELMETSLKHHNLSFKRVIENDAFIKFIKLEKESEGLRKSKDINSEANELDELNKQMYNRGASSILLAALNPDL